MFLISLGAISQYIQTREFLFIQSSNMLSHTSSFRVFTNHLASYVYGWLVQQQAYNDLIFTLPKGTFGCLVSAFKKKLEKKKKKRKQETYLVSFLEHKQLHDSLFDVRICAVLIRVAINRVIMYFVFLPFPVAHSRVCRWKFSINTWQMCGSAVNLKQCCVRCYQKRWSHSASWFCHISYRWWSFCYQGAAVA